MTNSITISADILEEAKERLENQSTTLKNQLKNAEEKLWEIGITSGYFNAEQRKKALEDAVWDVENSLSQLAYKAERLRKAKKEYEYKHNEGKNNV